MLADPARVTRPVPAAGGDHPVRCGWAVGEVLQRYHDEEWGRPLHGDAALFEKLSLEGFQSGLSWLVVLRKRPAFRAAFAGFDPAAVAAFGAEDVERLLADAGLIRNRRKIEAVVANARAVTALLAREGAGALDALVWSHAPAAHRVPVTPADVPASSPESVALAAALKAAGLVFVGPVTVYALMQSAGVVDDHVAGCFRSSAGRAGALAAPAHGSSP